MGFCTSQDVTDLVATTLADAVVLRLITKADRKISARLKTQGLAYSFNGVVPDDIIEASAHFTAALILNKHMVDGTLPATMNIPGGSGSVDVPAVIAFHTTTAESFLSGYVEANVDDSSSSSGSGFRMIGRDGERIGTLEDMDEYLEEEV